MDRVAGIFSAVVFPARNAAADDRARAAPSRSATAPERRLRFALPPWEPNSAILLDPELKLGEAYMDGTLVVEQGSIADFLHLAMSQDHVRQSAALGAAAMARCATSGAGCSSSTRASRARRNVAHHYDLDRRLYALFLDADRQYSCAYFEQPDQSLDDAQLAKKRHIAAKLLVAPDARVLDIGSGWGGLALYLAEMCGARVTGVTLSDEQLALRATRADEKGLPAGSSSACRIIATSRRASTASCRSACSSMSASATTTRSSANAPSCSTRTA